MVPPRHVFDTNALVSALLFTGSVPGRAFLAAFLRRAELIEVEQRVEVCWDPKDGKSLSLALAGGASVIVSGDEDLLVLDPFRGARILRPQEFLAEVAEG